MIKEKSVNYLLIILLIISVSFNLLAWGEIQDINDSVKKLRTENQNKENKGLELIENKYTENLDEENEWKTYRNEKYGFEIKYPEKFEEKKVEIKKVSFNNREDFYSTRKEGRVSDNVVSTFGSFKTARHLIDFHTTKDKMIESQVFKVKSSLFTIAIHPNESNLPFEDFVSQEILSFYKGDEKIEDQRIIKINGVEGYRFVYRPIPGRIGIIYYLPSQDNKTIISIGTPIELLYEVLRSDDPYFEFSKISPRYRKEIEKSRKLIGENYNDFIKKYPDYEKFLEHFSFEHTKKELNKRLLFEKVVYSFKFY